MGIVERTARAQMLELVGRALIQMGQAIVTYSKALREAC